MSDTSYDIIFRGRLVAGHELADVKTRLVQLFKADTAKIDSLFSGKAIPLKRNLDRASADKYFAVLTRAGAEVEICNPVATQPPDAVKPDAEAARAARLAEQSKRRAERRAKQQEATGKPLTMAERLSQEKAAQEKPAAAAVKTGADEGASAKRDASESVDEDFSVAPAGSDLLAAGERVEPTAAAVDVSAITLRDQVGDLLDSSEKSKTVEVDIDLDAFSLASTGEDLLQQGEKTVVEAVEVDTSSLVLDEVGADMIREDEKKPSAVIDVDVEGIKLAPVGSDMGQLKDNKPPVSPDTSGLSISP